MKRIAVLLGAINLDNQKKLLEGMISATKQNDCNLFVFTNYIGSRETLESITTATRIFDLIDFSCYDGVVLAGNSVYHPTALQKILTEIQKHNIPCVSIDQFHRNMSTIEISSYYAQFSIVEHFITQHKCKQIAYVSGPTSRKHKEATTRLHAFLDVMEKHNITVLPEQIYEGFFTLESGVDVAHQILKKGSLPDAIICANDDMALGVMETILKAGYRIPDDVRISGFDNIELSKFSNPTLTTVDQNQYAVGSTAVCEILELIDGKMPDTHVVSCEIKCRESCGCREISDGRLKNSLIGEKYFFQQHDTIRMSEVVRSMETDFSKTDTLQKLINVLKNHIPHFGVEEFYLCLCDTQKVFALPDRNLGQNINILEINETFTPEIEIPLIYMDNTFFSCDKLETKQLLPSEYTEKTCGKVYYVNQIYYQNCCYGYVACKASLNFACSPLYNLCLMEIGVGLENTRKWMLLNDAVGKLNGIWCYDNLTNLYNRSGFYYEAKAMLDNCIEKDKNIFILFMDADGLKKVNDNIGHEAGDILIKTLGNIVLQHTTPDMLSMRYGGDEFVLLGTYEKTKLSPARNLIDTIQSSISKVNDERKYPFRLSVSIGESSWRARDVDDISKLIELADQQMYEVKKSKRGR